MAPRRVIRYRVHGRFWSVVGLVLAVGCGRGGDRPFVWHFRYDALGRVVATTDPSGRTVVASHQLVGATLGGGIRYDGPTERLTCSWDERGRPASAHGASGTTRYEFDDQERLVRMESDDVPAVEISYDGHGRPAVMRVGGIEHSRYAYDFLGRLVAIDTAAGHVALAYGRGQDDTSTETRTLPNGVKSTWRFDPSGRLISLHHVDADESLIARYTCTYDAAGRLMTLVEESASTKRSLAYSYDAGGRLVGVAETLNDSDRHWAYEYDPLGGRTLVRGMDGAEVTARFDWAGRLLEHHGRAVTHDALGSVAAIGRPGDGRFEYSGEGRLVTAERDTGGVTYTYDAEGQLASRQTDSGTVRWICSPMGDVFEPLASVHDDGSRTLYLWDRGRPLAAVSYGRVKFFLTDPVGSVRVTTTGKGAVASRSDFDPFGVPAEQPPEDMPLPGFAGMFYDPIAALYLTPRRAYDPALGQFLQRDPVHATPRGSVEDLSPYAYCGNDPVNLVDHSGARAARPRDRYAGYDPGSRAVAERWNARVAAGTASRSRVIQGNRTRTTYYDQDGLTNAWATENDAAGGGWIDQEWRRAYVRARNSVEGLSREYVELVNRVGVIAAQQDPLAATLQHARQYMDAFGPPPPDLLPRPVAGETNAGIPSYRAYNAYTGELIELGGYGAMRPRAGSQGSSGRPQVDGGGSSGTDAVTGDEGSRGSGITMRARGAIDMEIDDVIDGIAVPRRPPVDLDSNDFLGGEPVPREVPARRRSDLEQFADWAVGMAARRPRVRSDLEVFMDLVEAMRGGSMSPVVTPDPPSYTPRGRPQSDLEVFRQSVLGSSGSGSAGTYPGDDEIREGQRIVLAPPDEPTAVGGVWLGGAAAALPDMGLLAGVAVDENGRLILLSRDDARIDLPPLRLDDVVTIFRCVYEHGQSPSVSIDAPPGRPDDLNRIVCHGPGTEDTYVGWILYQADRVMKDYANGTDRVTNKRISSRVPEYRTAGQLQIEMAAENARVENPKAVYSCRYWIVPAQVNRESNGTAALSLLNVPLKLNAETKIRVGNEDRAEPRNLPSDQAYADWFSAHYDDVADEFFLEPPPESGLTGKVAIFRELQRMATTAAAAEALRLQGVAYPHWMRSFQVRPCPVPETSRHVITDTVDGQGKVIKIQGGIGLTPTDDQMKEVTETPRAVGMAVALSRAITSTEPLTAASIATAEEKFRAVPLPGADTVDLGAARLAEVDLVVPFGRGHRLDLVRQFNSFFQPGGPWGPTWTLDLPALEVLPWREKYTINGGVMGSYYRLSSPLGSISATLRERKHVPELGFETTAPDRPGSVLGMLADIEDPRIGVATERMAMRDGSCWHFFPAAERGSAAVGPPAGLLAAIETGPTLIAYRWDTDQRLTRIEGFIGPQSMATIDLEYDGRGRLAKAVGRGDGADATADYTYTADGSLAAVTTSLGARRYAYRDGLVSSVHLLDSAGDRLLVAFEYGSGGRLRAMSLADGSRAEYRLARTPAGTRLETVVTDTSGARRTLATSFDAAMNPLEQALADGSVLSTEILQDDAGTKTTLRLPDGRTLTEEVSCDGKGRDFQLPSGTRYRKEYDPDTRAATLSVGDQLIVRQRMHADGTLAALEFPGLAVRPRYDDDNRLSGALVTEPDRKESYAEWLEVEYDSTGRPGRVTDHQGRDHRIERAADGRRTTIVSDGRATTISADSGARTVTVSTSTDDTGRMAFDEQGRITSVTLDRGGTRARIEFEAGRPVRGQGFDGGETTYAYVTDGPAEGRLEQLTYPHGLVVRYGYDARGRLETATLGDIRRYRYERDPDGRLLSMSVEPVSR